MYIIGGVGALCWLAGVVMISVASLICYVKSSRVPAAVMFISSVVAIATELARAIYPYLMRNQSLPAGTITWQYIVPMQILGTLTGISMFVFAVAFWRLQRHVAPRDEAG